MDRLQRLEEFYSDIEDVYKNKKPKPSCNIKKCLDCDKTQDFQLGRSGWIGGYGNGEAVSKNFQTKP